MNTRRLATFIAIAVTGAGLWTAFDALQTHDPAATARGISVAGTVAVADGESSSTPRANPTPPADHCRWRAGHRLGLQLQVDTRFRVDAGALLGQGSGAVPGWQTRQSRARLDIEVLHALSDVDGPSPRWVLAVALSDLEIELDGARQGPTVTEPLERAIYLQADEDCRLWAIAGFEADGRAAAEELAPLLLMLDTRPSGLQRGAAAAWTTTQHDRVGEFDVDYERQSDGKLLRRKRRYRSAAPIGPRKDMHAELLRSSATLVPGAASELFARADVDEHVRVSAGGRLFAEVQSQLELARANGPSSSPSANLRARDIPAVDLRWHPLHEALPRAIDRDPYAKRPIDPNSAQRPLDEVLREFTALLSLDEDTKRDAALQVLVHHLRARPERVDDLGRELETGFEDARIRSYLFLGLEKTSNSQSLALLNTIAHDANWGVDDRVRAIAALADTANVDTETIDGLRALVHARSSDDPGIANAAELALGTVSSRSDLRAPARAGLTGELGARLDMANSPEDIVVALQAIGNSGQSQFEDLVVGHLESRHAVVRRTALSALIDIGRAPDPRQLWIFVTEDPDPALRNRAAGVLASAPRLPAPVRDALRDELRGVHEPEDIVRFVNIAGPHAAHDEGLAMTLIELFSNSRNADVKVAIGNHIGADRL